MTVGLLLLLERRGTTHRFLACAWKSLLASHRFSDPRGAPRGLAWKLVYRHLGSSSGSNNNNNNNNSKDSSNSSIRKKDGERKIDEEGQNNVLKFPENRTFRSEVFTMPNMITISRVIASPYLGYMIYKVLFVHSIYS